VLHLRNDSALEFTRAYLAARLSGTATTQTTAPARRPGRRRKPPGNAEGTSEPNATTPEKHRETSDTTKTSATNLRKPGSAGTVTA
jgi:hypothetical protein